MSLFGSVRLTSKMQLNMIIFSSIRARLTLPLKRISPVAPENIPVAAIIPFLGFGTDNSKEPVMCVKAVPMGSGCAASLLQYSKSRLYAKMHPKFYTLVCQL